METLIEEKIIETETADKPIKILHESLFWLPNDPRRFGMPKDSSALGQNRVCHEINLFYDSYIIVFTGRRGGGKTTSMTFFAIKQAIDNGMRILSNYPIECTVNMLDHTQRHVKSEPLDIERLLSFDKDYKNCLIVIDEAPDIISHMAAMTWKNRLLNVFIRQLRKNHNSFFAGAQEFELLDKSFRWQTDVLVECEDASRKWGWHPSTRGKLILQNWLDNSGLWTGRSYQQEIKERQSRGDYKAVGQRARLYPRFLWENDGFAPVFNSFEQTDVWESLKRVAIKFDAYNINPDASPENELSNKDTYDIAREAIRAAKEDKGVIASPDFYSSLPNLNAAMKDKLSKDINKLPGLKQRKLNNRWALDFSNVDPDSLRSN